MVEPAGALSLPSSRPPPAFLYLVSLFERGRRRAQSGGCSRGELPGRSGDVLPRTSSRWRWRRRLGAELSGRGARQPSRSERRGALGRSGDGDAERGGAAGLPWGGAATGRRGAARPAVRRRGGCGAAAGSGGAGIFFLFFYLFDKKINKKIFI